MNNVIERKIKKLYESIYKKIFTHSRLISLSKGMRSEIEKALILLSSSDAYTELAKKLSKDLAKKGLRSQQGIWRKYYNEAKKVHYVALPKTFTEYELNVLQKAVEHNFNMIKSIPTKMMEIMNKDYTQTLIEEVAKNKISRGSFEKQLASHGVKQAKLIARTETAKLQTAIAEDRARDLGSVAYIWRSSNDKRTRPSHKKMNNVIVFWRSDNEKPLLDGMRGNAGEFPNCRCDTQPIVDIDQLTKSTYQLYDYNSNSIVTKTKSEVIKYLTSGGIK